MEGDHTAQRLGWRFMAGALAGFALIAFAGEAGCSGMSDSQSTLEERFATARQLMVREQIERRGIRDGTVLAAMSQVPRHMFVPEELRDRAYDDTPLPIGQGQTISQPYIVAYMTEAIRPQAGDRVLEVGTGSGYQAAVLARIVTQVYTIEILPDLAETASRILNALDFGNVTVRVGDGFRGWPEEAPFDAILVTAAPEAVPQPLLGQLKVGGRLVIPVGSGDQQLVRWTRTESGFESEPLLPVRFVPMTGEALRAD